MRHLKLMPDYFCYPLWDVDDPGNIDPATLPLSDALRARLNTWAETFDRILDIDDPASSPGFASDAAEREFDDDGRRLWHDVAAELGPGYSVSYYSIASSKLLPPPAELA